MAKRGLKKLEGETLGQALKEAKASPVALVKSAPALPHLEGGFRCILADPPWQFNSLWGGRPKKTESGNAKFSSRSAPRR